MKRKAWIVIPAAAVLLAGNCEEITTELSEFKVGISVSSTILDSQGDTLVGDVVTFSVTVTENDDTIQVSDPVFSSSNPNVVEIDAETGAATFKSAGIATVSVDFGDAGFPEELLSGELAVPVDSFYVEITPSSPTFDEKGLFLQSDSLDFSARVKRSGDREVPTSGQQFVSTNPAVLAFVDAAAGRAVLLTPGQAQVSVKFASPKIPLNDTLQSQGTENWEVDVRDFSLSLSAASKGATNHLALGDTLVSDTVVFTATLIQDGAPLAINDAMYTSFTPSVVEILDSENGVARLVGAGTATVELKFTDPQVPVQRDTVFFPVGTYLVDVSSVASPIMGDTVTFTATITDTRTGETVPGMSPFFESSDPSVIRILNAGTGVAHIRDIGQADVMVKFLVSPMLPNDTVRGSAAQDISVEQFYGAFSDSAGDFGDPIFVDSTGVHSFTDSTRVEFPNGTVGFVTQRDPDLLRFTVGAGTNSGALILRNLRGESGEFRDNVPTRFTFMGGGTIDDAFEPNDEFPLNANHEITGVPFNAILSIEPNVTPPDSDFFFIRVPSGPALIVNITADWQQVANIDFFVCNGIGDPPTGYDDLACARDKTANNSDPNAKTEEATGVSLGPGRHVLGFYCADPADCPAVAATYRVNIQ